MVGFRITKIIKQTFGKKARTDIRGITSYYLLHFKIIVILDFFNIRWNIHLI
jgi:hypothetical protein